MLLEIIFAYPTQSFAACGVSSGTLVSPPACLLVHHVFEIRIILVNKARIIYVAYYVYVELSMNIIKSPMISLMMLPFVNG